MAAADGNDTGAPTGTGGKPVSLHQRFDIDPSAPLVDLDRPSAPAFAVADRRLADGGLFAFICETELPIRSEAAALLKGTDVPGLLPLVDFGPVDWPPLQRQCLAVVYRRPRGGSIADLRVRKQAAIVDHDIPRRILQPLLRALRAIERLGLTHRSIRPDNLYFIDEEREELVLGDCVTVAAAFHQPSLLEPLERAMACPAGRGEGRSRDDVHALAGTLLLIRSDRPPVAELGEDEALTSRMDEGTYATLTRGIRVPVALIEPLRCMLSDDPEERWGLDELELWLDGRRPHPPKRKPRPKGAVAFSFAGRDHHRPRPLAHALARNARDAAKVIRDGQLEQWLARGVEAPALAKAVGRVVALDSTRQHLARDRDDLLVAEVCIALDPDAPIRYKGLSVMVDGFGAALAQSWLSGDHGQIPAEILTHGLPGLWLAAQGNVDSSTAPLQQRVARLAAYLQRDEPAFGLLRCLYQANPGLSCRSPLLEGRCVVGLVDIVPALDAVAGRVAADAKPLDPHMAAFVAARFGDDGGPYLAALADCAPGRSVAAMLSVLALLQRRFRLPPVPALTDWVAKLLGPVIDSYHSASLRRELEREIAIKARAGSLSDLYEVVENPIRRRTDEESFCAAVAAFAAAGAEIEAIEKGAEQRWQSARRLGRRAAATASVAISMIVIAATLVSRLI